MNPVVLSLAFSAAILASLLVKFWLATRQMRHVAAHRGAVPRRLRRHRAARGAPEGGRLHASPSCGSASSATPFGSAVLIGWTLLGGLAGLNAVVRELVPPRWGDMAYQLALVGAFVLIGALIDLPFDLYSTFRLEQRFGFNKITPRAVRRRPASSRRLLGIAIGGPLLALVLWIMQATGALWWVWAWGALTVFQLLAMVIYPDADRAAVQQVRAAGRRRADQRACSR